MEKWLSFIIMAMFAVLFTAIVFYAAHTIFPTKENDCWGKYPYDTPAYGKDINYNDPAVQAEQAAQDKKRQECDVAFQAEQKNTEGKKLILIGVINVIVLGILFFIGMTTIGLGLLLGIILSSIIATINYWDSSSIIALAIVVVLFVEVIIFIQRNWTRE